MQELVYEASQSCGAGSCMVPDSEVMDRYDNDYVQSGASDTASVSANPLYNNFVVCYGELHPLAAAAVCFSVPRAVSDIMLAM